MAIREDAILLAGFALGQGIHLPSHVQGAIDRIVSAKEEGSMPIRLTPNQTRD